MSVLQKIYEKCQGRAVCLYLKDLDCFNMEESNLRNELVRLEQQGFITLVIRDLDNAICGISITRAGVRHIRPKSKKPENLRKDILKDIQKKPDCYFDEYNFFGLEEEYYKDELIDLKKEGLITFNEQLIGLDLRMSCGLYPKSWTKC